MPTFRDWLQALAAVLVFSTVTSAIDPAAPAELPRIGQERTMNRYLTEEEQTKLLWTLKLHSGDPLAARDYAWVRALRHSGLRIQEFSHISVGDALAALRSGYLFVPREHRKGWNRKPTQDGKLRKPPKDHSVYLTDALRRALQDLLKCRFELTGADCREFDPLVVSRHGTAMSVRSYQLRLSAWAEKAGLPPGVSPHWLRHTRAMAIMQSSTARDPRGVVQKALGHADIRSSGVYTQTPREEVEAALDEIDVGAAGRVTLAALRRAFYGRAAA
ncbi:tyrosine-type recombinase/integrase [Propionivibrio sp.]|uniref:tyrosine-type recombinase/integrase n=1 Tax=Propionivibrio sp. TaxID=2212460 RepID=UPI0039E47DE1